MVKKLIDSLDSGDFRTFLYFLGISALLWLLGNLSEEYDARASFKLNLMNCPDSLGIYKEDPPVIYARLRASGFRFLTGSYGRKGLDVDLSGLQMNLGRFFMHRSQMTNVINRKLPQEVELLSLEQDSFYMPVYRKVRRELPVRADLTYELEPNHRLKGPLQLTPSQIEVEGPASEVQGLQAIYTEPIQLGTVSESINQIVTVIPPEDLTNIALSATTIRIFGEVGKFSEAVFDVAVKVEDAPEGLNIRIVPKQVQVVCQAEQARLNSLSPADFRVYARFPKDSNGLGASQRLPLYLNRQPDSVYAVRLLQKEVSYFLE